MPRAESGCTNEDWSYRDEIDDIAQAVTTARAESPGRSVLLLGHSLGGQLVAGHELTRPPADGPITTPAQRHIGWVRTPATVVDHIVTWWQHSAHR